MNENNLGRIITGPVLAWLVIYTGKIVTPVASIFAGKTGNRVLHRRIAFESSFETTRTEGESLVSKWKRSVSLFREDARGKRLKLIPRVAQ